MVVAITVVNPDISHVLALAQQELDPCRELAEESALHVVVSVVVLDEVLLLEDLAQPHAISAAGLITLLVIVKLRLRSVTLAENMVMSRGTAHLRTVAPSTQLAKLATSVDSLVTCHAIALKRQQTATWVLSQLILVLQLQLLLPLSPKSQDRKECDKS